MSSEWAAVMSKRAKEREAERRRRAREAEEHEREAARRREEDARLVIGAGGFVPWRSEG